MWNHVEKLFGEVPSDLHNFAICSQISNAEAMKFFVERFRIGKWDRTGIIWWNVIDCWPQFSEATLDYYFTKKQSYFHLKQAQQPFCIMVSEKDESGNRELVAVNDTNDELTFDYTVIDAESNKEIVGGCSTIGKNEKINLSKLPADIKEHGLYYIEWELNGEKCYNHYLYGEPAFDYKTVMNWFEKFGIFKAEGFQKG